MVNTTKKVGALLAILLGAVSACGVKDLDFTYASGGSSGASASGGSAGAANEVPTSCREGQKRCSGDTPQTCDADGEWQDGKACSSNQACTGAGVCAPYRLVDAGIDSLGQRPPEKKIVIKQQTLASSPRLCAKSGVCITGAIK